eukprot:jgi/Mesvir1/10782/Mv13839-RA.1
MSDFNELPDEIVAQILQFVARDSSYCCTTLLQLAAVCTKWRRLAFSHRVARELWLPADAPSVSLLYAARRCVSCDRVGPHTLIIDSRTFVDPAMQRIPWEVKDVFGWDGWREAMQEVRRSAQSRSPEGSELSPPPPSQALVGYLEMPLALLGQVLKLLGGGLQSISFRFCSSAGSSLLNERAIWLIARHCDRTLARLAMLSSFDGAVCDAHAYLLTAKLPNLSTFWCDGGSACFTDRALWHIGYGWQSLRSLCVAGDGVTVEGMLALRRCPVLGRLKLEHCRAHLFDPTSLFLLLKKVEEEACHDQLLPDDAGSHDGSHEPLVSDDDRSSSSHHGQRGSLSPMPAHGKELAFEDTPTEGVMFPQLRTISFDGTPCSLAELSVVALVCPRLSRVVVRVMSADDNSTPDHMDLFKLQSSPLFSTRRIRVRGV